MFYGTNGADGIVCTSRLIPDGMPGGTVAALNDCALYSATTFRFGVVVISSTKPFAGVPGGRPSTLKISSQVMNTAASGPNSVCVTLEGVFKTTVCSATESTNFLVIVRLEVAKLGL